MMVISNHAGRDDVEVEDSKLKPKLHHQAIRGKWSGGGVGYASSSSSDDDDIKLANISEDDESSTSTSSNQSLTSGLVEASGNFDNNTVEEGHRNTTGVRAAATSKPRIKQSKSKDDKVLQRLGRPPSILLPIDTIQSTTAKQSRTSSSTNGGTNTMKAIEVPSVHLPTNYLRDNPNWKVTSVAQILLSYWEQLNNTINTSALSSSPSASGSPTIIVVLLQSGRFASAIYSLQHQQHKNYNNNNNTTPKTMLMIAHKTSTRYTVRKGQGGSQSNFDQSKHKAKSIGAQLRREGERQLRQDVHETWKNWRKMGYVSRAVGVYVSCPKSMRRDYLYTTASDDENAGLMDKKDDRWRSIPLDVGRPTLDATSAVLECLLSCTVRDATEEEYQNRRRIVGASLAEDDELGSTRNDVETKMDMKDSIDIAEIEISDPVVEVKPYTPLHEAVLEGDLNHLIELLDLLDLKESQEKEGVDETQSLTTKPSRDNYQKNGLVESIDYDINTGGGPECFTPLHLASSSTHPNAPALLSALLIHGHANPCAIDTRGRPPYFVAASDKHRDSFRLARGTLGEEYCQWDEEAKVGPALSDSDLQLKKAKALEKKRRQRARQKETRAIEKVEAERAQAEEQARLEKLKEEEDAKRIRDGLKPKPLSATSNSNVCDFCQMIVKGKRRSQMFHRLDYAYCSTECVKRHQRELMAAAATARLGGGG